MRALRLCVFGIALLVAAQVIASLSLARMRVRIEPPGGSSFTAVTPGEFAGTLMLGGFRGLACDMLWMRADTAQEHGRFYESLALYDTISRIQPRFEEVWSYLSYDMAYNLGHGVEDDESKWSWMLAGIETNVTGCLRNPQSARLLSHLGWMFNHRGDLFQEHIRTRPWDRLLQPLLDQVNGQILPEHRLPPCPTGTGLSNYRLAAIIYRASVVMAQDRHLPLNAFYPRSIALAIESDGDTFRNRGQHLAALGIWIEALEEWRHLHAVYDTAPVPDPGDEARRRLGLDAWMRNEGRLRRKAAEMARMLAPDPDTGEATAQDILQRRFDSARARLAIGSWLVTAHFGRIRWLDEQ